MALKAAVSAVTVIADPDNPLAQQLKVNADGSINVNADVTVETANMALETGGHLASIDTEIGAHLGNIDTASAAAKSDLDTLAGGVSGGQFQASVADMAVALRHMVDALAKLDLTIQAGGKLRVTPVSGSTEDTLGTVTTVAGVTTVTGITNFGSVPAYMGAELSNAAWAENVRRCIT